MSEYHKSNEYSQESYQTGSTRPPKSYGGIIAFLLVLVIFLSGIVSVLGLMNIRLFRMVEKQDSQDVSLMARCAPAQQDIAIAQYTNPGSTLGIVTQDVTAFYQHYYSIPQGAYVLQVESGSDCYAKGLRTGDVLTHFNGLPVTGTECLDDFLQSAMPGEVVELTFHRTGIQHQITVTLDVIE